MYYKRAVKHETSVWDTGAIIECDNYYSFEGVVKFEIIIIIIIVINARAERNSFLFPTSVLLIKNKKPRTRGTY